VHQLVNNPQALFSSGALEQLQEQFANFGAQGQTLLKELLATLKGALSTSLSEVFLISFSVVVFAFLVNFFLREIPLRKYH